MPRAFAMYMLWCSDGQFYVGSTGDLERRLAEHGEGLVRSTHDFRPVKLVYVEHFPTREDAKRKEHQVKRWSRAKKAALVRGDVDRLKELARSRGPSTSLGQL